MVLPACTWGLTEEQWEVLNGLKFSRCPLRPRALFAVCHDSLGTRSFSFWTFLLVQGPATSLNGFRQADGRRLSGTCLRSVDSLEWDTLSLCHTGPTLTLQSCINMSTRYTVPLPVIVHWNEILPEQKPTLRTYRLKVRTKWGEFRVLALFPVSWWKSKNESHFWILNVLF